MKHGGLKQRLIASFVLIGLMLLSWWNTSLRASLQQANLLTLFSGEAMTIDYHITVGSSLTPAEKQTAQRLINEAFEEIHAVCNQWNPNSCISHLNQMPANQKQLLPSLLAEVLGLADRVVHSSQGRYDPTIEPLKQVWLPFLKQGLRPSSEQIAAIIPQMGWHRLHLEEGYFWKDHDKLTVNLDSIAKGACVDLLTQKLTQAGFSDLLVEWGGEVRAAGQHPSGRPWQLFIRRLNNPDPVQALARLDLENAALATSGDYFQFWESKEPERTATYFHIFNPKTLQPLTMQKGSIASVTVKAPSCALADALATAGMFCENLEEAEKWAKQVQAEFPDTSFWFAARKASKSKD